MKTMRLLAVLVLLAAIAALPGASLSQDAKPAGKTLSLDQVVTKLQENYQKIDTYILNFDQQLYSPQQDRVISKGSGSVWFKKPGKMLWSYEKPEPHIYVTEGNTVWEYTPNDKTVNIFSLEQAAYRSFLLGFGNLKRDFKIKFHKGKAKSDSGLYQLDLTANNPAEREAIGTVTFYVDPEHFMVRYAELVDSFGNENRLRFQDMKANVPIDDKHFKFKVPKGVKVNNYKNTGKKKGNR